MKEFAVTFIPQERGRRWSATVYVSAKSKNAARTEGYRKVSKWVGADFPLRPVRVEEK